MGFLAQLEINLHWWVFQKADASELIPNRTPNRTNKGRVWNFTLLQNKTFSYKNER